MQTEFPITLPRGYTDPSGVVHREGAMRRATAADETAPVLDVRVKENPGYLGLVILSVVMTRLGPITDVQPDIIEGLYSEDLAYLKDFYTKINGHEPGKAEQGLD